MSSSTFHTTRQDIRKDESRVAHQHDGKTPADSDVSQMKVRFSDLKPQNIIANPSLVYHRPEHQQA